MTDAAVMQCSRTYPVAVEQAFDTVLSVPLEQIFDRRYGPIPPIRSTDGYDGAWGAAGQTRTVRLAGGATMREELTSVERPNSFGYVLRDVTGPMSPLAAQVEGLWSFDPAGTGMRITWRWTVHPASRTAAMLLPAFARFWRGFARQGLERIEDLLVPA